MNKEHFLKQLARLKSQWPNSYGDERSARIWTVFKDVMDDTFTGMIDIAIDRMRQAPLADDLGKFEQEVKNREFQNRVSYGAGRSQFGQVIGDAEKANNKTKSADPDFVKACIKLLKDKTEGRITKAQFLEGCDALDQLAKQLEPRPKSHYGGNKFYDRGADEEKIH